MAVFTEPLQSRKLRGLEKCPLGDYWWFCLSTAYLSFIELGQYLRGQTRSNEVIKVKSGPCLVPTGECDASHWPREPPSDIFAVLYTLTSTITPLWQDIAEFGLKP